MIGTYIAPAVLFLMVYFVIVSFLGLYILRSAKRRANKDADTYGPQRRTTL
ncbi:MAG: hypothetical protein ACXVZV_02845 [Terriglobales bacterium]